MRVYQTFAEEMREQREIDAMESEEMHELECERNSDPMGRCYCDER